MRGAFSLRGCEVLLAIRAWGPCSTYPAVLGALWTMKNCPVHLKKHGAVPSESCPCGQTRLLCLLGTRALRRWRESSPSRPGPSWVRPRAPPVPEQPAVRCERRGSPQPLPYREPPPCRAPQTSSRRALPAAPTLSTRAPVLWGRLQLGCRHLCVLGLDPGTVGTRTGSVVSEDRQALGCISI